MTSSSADEPIISELKDSHLLITLNRPSKHNALNADVLDRLHRLFLTIVAQPHIRAVVITGAGAKSFCAGADLDALVDLDPAVATDMMAAGQATMSAIAECAVPVICAVNGHALGGGFELALSSTFILASTRATFGLPETSLGLIPGYGGTQRLPRLVGRQQAGYLITTGSRWNADDAYRVGLLAEAPLDPDALLPRAEELAELVASRGPSATRSALGLLRASESGLDSALAHETAVGSLMVSGPESTEGVGAFLSRRSPDYGVRE
jgi:enoyl-CoA hydratase